MTGRTWEDLRGLARRLSSDSWFYACGGNLEDVTGLIELVREVQHTVRWVSDDKRCACCDFRDGLACALSTIVEAEEFARLEEAEKKAEKAATALDGGGP